MAGHPSTYGSIMLLAVRVSWPPFLRLGSALSCPSFSQPSWPPDGVKPLHAFSQNCGPGGKDFFWMPLNGFLSSEHQKSHESAFLTNASCSCVCPCGDPALPSFELATKPCPSLEHSVLRLLAVLSKVQWRLPALSIGHHACLRGCGAFPHVRIPPLAYCATFPRVHLLGLVQSSLSRA